MPSNVELSLTLQGNGIASHTSIEPGQLKQNLWTGAFEEQKTIQSGGDFSANSTTTFDDTNMATKMFTSLDNLETTAVQKIKIIEKFIEMNNKKNSIISRLTESLKDEKVMNKKVMSLITQSFPSTNTSGLYKVEMLLNIIPMGTAGAMATSAHGNIPVTPVRAARKGIKQEQPKPTQWVEARTTRDGNHNLDGMNRQEK
ncbi:LOW QUALITY PROTEIN: hypothetical protein ACHAW6_005604 [Cyclotella cf. meneghiniana]